MNKKIINILQKADSNKKSGKWNIIKIIKKNKTIYKNE